MHVEVIAVGRELLRGRLGEGNAKRIAETLAARGGLVHRIYGIHLPDEVLDKIYHKNGEKLATGLV